VADGTEIGGRPTPKWVADRLRIRQQARVEVTEHQVQAVRCTCCGEVTRGAFPSEMPAPTQYGPMMKAFAVHCDNYQLLPIDRALESRVVV